jgi:hypothetical protein
MTSKREQMFLQAHGMTNALRMVKAQQAERRRNLADPNYRLLRYFPTWHPAMTTDEYIGLFQALNRKVKDEVGLTFHYLRTQA